jgi:hypothetical protein
MSIETLTLRDFFAAAALAGLVVDKDLFSDEIVDSEDFLAQRAYAFADFMIEARNKKETA